jgi:hypothetical protein
VSSSRLRIRKHRFEPQPSLSNEPSSCTSQTGSLHQSLEAYGGSLLRPHPRVVSISPSIVYPLLSQLPLRPVSSLTLTEGLPYAVQPRDPNRPLLLAKEPNPHPSVPRKGCRSNPLPCSFAVSAYALSHCKPLHFFHPPAM